MAGVMADTSNRPVSDASDFAIDHDCEVRFLIEWYGMTEDQARELIADVGNDREKLDEAAEKLIA